MFITLFQQPREREPATSPNQTTVFTEGEHGEGNKVMEKHTGCPCVGDYLKSLAGNIVSRLRDLFLKVLQGDSSQVSIVLAHLSALYMEHS